MGPPPLYKRTASASPDGERPFKRQATSSPEEGELDDDASTPPPSVTRSPGPTKTTKPATKVPFPFKKKAALPDQPYDSPAPQNGVSKPRVSHVVYERSVEDDRRYREDDRRHNQIRHPHEDYRQGQSRADHWDAQASRRAPVESVIWDHDEPYLPPPERERPERRGRPQRSVTPPHRNDRRYPSRSPSSPRSHSPESPSSTRGKHRLPPPRSPKRYEPAAETDFNNWKCREYPRDRRRNNSGSRSRHAGRDFDRYHTSEDDRYYRPSRESQEQFREWRRDNERYAPARHDGLELPPDEITYRLMSPRAGRPMTPGSDKPYIPPEEPLGSPPRDIEEPLLTKHTALPKKPSTPVPPALMEPAHGLSAEKDASNKSNGQIECEQKKVLIQRQRRKPVHRTREEEEAAYGRTFAGCGKKSDYDILTKLGEGTFGEVHKAIHKTQRHVVALKRILMHNEREGMPVTALREIKILKALRHPCIVDLLDMFVVRSQGKDSPLSVYMVFPYMDHDLAGLLENERVKLSPSQIKLYMKQLLEGTEYMHRNHVLHRDMKAANLLISNTGSLKIADFGLARAFDPKIVREKEDWRGKERKYTNCVVTRWYRPPELLLGARQYGGEVDMWGIGCVLGEMFWRRPILPGSSDLDQLDKIWQLCGTPNQHSWPNYDTLPGCEGVKRFGQYPRRVKQVFEMIGSETCDLLDKLLTCNPRERMTAAQALDHDYFWTDPLPADPKTLPLYEASHEFDKRGRRNQPPPGPPVLSTNFPMPSDGPQRMPPAPAVQYGRPPPPRESFRAGPPPTHHTHTQSHTSHSHSHSHPHSHAPPLPPLSRPPPPPPNYGYPSSRYPPPPVPPLASAPTHNYAFGPPPPVLLPQQLAPLHLRPGQPPPQLTAWQPPPPPLPPPIPPGVLPPSMSRPAHLPPRPAVPGRANGYPPRQNGHGGGGGGLNYG